MDSWVPVVLVAVFILANGFFVAAEFAILGAPRAAMERRAAQGQKLARLVATILHDPKRQDQYIATAQLGITFASLGLGMYGEHQLAEWLEHHFAEWGLEDWPAHGAAAGVVAVGILTYFHIVVGEMVPKSMVLSRAESASLIIVRPMRWVRVVLYPLVVALNALGTLLLRMVGIRRELTHNFHTREELERVIMESEEGGALDAPSGQLMRELLQIQGLTAGEVMTPRVRLAGLPLGVAGEELRRLVRAVPQVRYPVCRETLDQVIGVVHVKDLLPMMLESIPLAERHVKPVAFVPHTATVDATLAAMRSARAHMAIVMDEHGGTAGRIDEDDLLSALVGEVSEEGELAIVDEPGGALRVDGTVRLAELSEWLERDVTQEGVHTVSGLVLALLGRPPRSGDRVTHGGAEFIVLKLLGRGVRSCRAQVVEGMVEEAEG